MTLLECYLPVVKMILKLLDETSSDYAECRLHCITVLNLAIQRAEEIDTSQIEKDAAQLAVVAWVDEMILSSTLSWRYLWQNELLQRKYLNITVAGEYFFTVLAQLKSHHQQARRVFLFCLQYGFRGKYSHPNDMPALQDVIAQQRRQCLPNDWQCWPNDAIITPMTPISMPQSGSLRRHRLLTFFIAILLAYGALYAFFYHYVF
ncbi:TPA: DotU family type IV/VI secretion system protein [Providencia alcalifaciens]